MYIATDGKQTDIVDDKGCQKTCLLAENKFEGVCGSWTESHDMCCCYMDFRQCQKPKYGG